METPLTYVTDIGEHNGDLIMVGSLGSQMFYATSGNQGGTWDTLNITEAARITGSPMYVGFFDDDHGTIGIKGSFEQDYLETRDGGTTWAPAPMPLDTSCNNLLQPYDFYLVSEGVGMVNGFQSGRYMMTVDGGETWSCSDDFGTSWVPQMHIQNDSVWYTKDNRGFYVTHNAGSTWERVIDKEFIHFQCTDDEIIALSTHYEEPDGVPVLYRTGDEWTTYESTPLVGFNEMYLTLFVETNSGGLYVLRAKDVFYSENGQSDFVLVQTLDDEPFRTTYLNDTWYLSGRGLAKLEDPLSSTSPSPLTGTADLYPNPASDMY